MKRVLQYYRILNLLSIDVALGAVVCAAFFARIFQVQIRPYGLASLGITVWIIYSIDHLLDARQLKKVASTKRHQFHQQNFKAISLWVVVAILADLVMILYIRRPVFMWGAGLASAILLYLIFQRLLNPFKELIGALLYSVGVLLPVLSLHTTSLFGSSLFLMSSFILTALTNMILFSWFDLEHDLKDTQLSIVTVLGKGNSKTLLTSLFIIQFVLFVGLQWKSTYQIEAFILLGMNLVLCLLFIFSEKVVEDDGYRLAGDVIFLFPLPYLILNG